MKRDCAIVLDQCPDVESPLSGHSSEANDPIVYIGIAYTPYNPFMPPTLGAWVNEVADCSQHVQSEVSQADADALALAAALECFSITIPVPPEPPTPDVPVSEVILPDGAGGFWMILVDTSGNIGTESVTGPATDDVILDDGAGGYWKLIADSNGNRGMESHAGPPTAGAVIEDSAGGFWNLIVDVNGNLGAESI